MLYTKVVKKLNPKNSHHWEKKFFFLISLILCINEMMDVH